MENALAKSEKGKEMNSQVNTLYAAIQTRNFLLLVLTGLSVSPFLLFSTIIIKKFKKFRKKNKELAGKNKNKDLFFSIISHDLKTPALNLISLSDLICSQKDMGTEETSKMNKLINSSAKKHYELLVNLLDWSKTQFNESYISKSNCKLHQLAENCIYYYKEALGLKELSIENKIPKDFSIRTNESMLATLFRNLLSNAIKFSNSGGSILIEVTQTNSDYIIKVEDQGVGMTSETIKNLFDINYIRSLRGTKKEVGTGLGLILCKEILNKLNGRLVVYSKENCGSKFLISLPLEQAQ